MGPGMKLQRMKEWPAYLSHDADDAARARVVESELGEAYWSWCLPCKTHHKFQTKLAAGRTGPVWQFNGDMVKPTFTPSLRYFISQTNETDERGNRTGRVLPERTTCHLFLRDGKLEYCSDCPHALAGQTVDLVGLP